MDFSQLNPCVRYAMRTTNGTTYEQELLAYDYRLFYIYENTVRIDTCGEAIELHPADLLILPPETGYRLILSPESPGVFALFNFDLDSQQYRAATHTPDPRARFDRTRIFSGLRLPPFDRLFVLREQPTFRDTTAHICTLMKQEPPFYADQLSAELKLLLVQAAAIGTQQPKPYPHMLDEVKDYLDTHCTQPISNQAIAARFGYHSYYLNQLFVTHFGQTMHAYLNAQKLKFAQQLLLSTDRSISDISVEAGFSGVSWFSEFFKNKVGVSPTCYRMRGR